MTAENGWLAVIEDQRPSIRSTLANGYWSRPPSLAPHGLIWPLPDRQLTSLRSTKAVLEDRPLPDRIWAVLPSREAGFVLVVDEYPSGGYRLP